MKFKTQKGSISLLVLITVLFYSSFLLLLYAKNLNKTTTLVEKVRNMKTAYINSTLEDAYEQILNKNTQGSIKEVSSKNNTDTSVLEINNTNQVTLADYRIYGEEYQETESIEGTGTQYLDTGLVDTEGWNAEIEFDLSKFGSSVSKWSEIIGTNVQLNGTYYRSYFAINNSHSFVLDVYSDYNNSTHLAELNKKYNVKASTFSGNGYLIVNDTTYKTTSVTFSAHDGAEEISIFKKNVNGKNSIASGKIYYCKFYDASKNLIRDFVPCYNKSRGTVGMYDLVNNKFHPGSGTGAFKKGNDITENRLSNINVGDLITDEADANNGKYKIEIKVTNKSGETYSKYIYLNKPLLSGEYIDYATKKVVRKDNTAEDIELPEITTYNEYTKIEVITKTKTPELKITYKK